MTIKHELIHSECHLCGEVEWINISRDDPRVERWLSGRLLVQDVFPELHTTDREVLIGWRTGRHICVNCWGVEDDS
jgi:hypothetical protein